MAGGRGYRPSRPAASIAPRERPRRPAPHRLWQGPRDVRPRGPAAARRVRSDLDVRRRPSDADPGQGQGAHRPVGLLVRAARGHRPEPLRLRHRRRARRGARPRAGRRASSSMLPVECVVRGYITGSGWKDYRATGVSRASSCRRACRSPSSCPSRSTRPSTKAEVGHDEAIDFEQTRRAAGRRPRAAPSRCATSRSSCTRKAAEHARERGVILADTKFELGRDAGGDALARRRGADARLLALLAGRGLRRRRASRASTSSTCATGRPRPAGTRRRRRRRSPTTSSPRTRAKYVEAYELITGEPFDAWLRADGAVTRVRVLGAAEGRDPRPAGAGGRARAAGARLRGRRQRPRRAAGRARRRGPRAAAGDVRASCSRTR